MLLIINMNPAVHNLFTDLLLSQFYSIEHNHDNIHVYTYTYMFMYVEYMDMGKAFFDELNMIDIFFF